MVLEPGERRQAEAGVDVTGQLADGPAGAPVRGEVEQFQALVLGALGEERGAQQLVAGADAEHHRTLGDRPVQAAVGEQALRAERLRAVLAAADEVDVGGGGQPLVGADLKHLDRESALLGPTGQDQGVAPVAVGRQQVRVDPDDAQGLS
ncbi:hypothetical protein GCM10029963_67680 [Micromonospora andamanensis]